jgi:CubicO group peptidase (beta-lactamase class C family)
VTSFEDEVYALVDGWSCVVSASHGTDVEFERPYGLADRAHAVPVTRDTQFGTASGTKAFTALTVIGLIDEGVLRLDTTARSVLGPDLPLIAGDVTVEHLLAHTSGIGDYLDEEQGEQPLKVPVQQLVDTEDYLPALDGFATKFAAGERFGYCNSGYVVLALIAERVARRPFHDLVAARVFEPAGMTDTAFLRSDALPGRAAIGYLDDGRTNVFHLPVRGNGDGGAYTTAADVRAFWAALFAGRIVPPDWVTRATAPRNEVPQFGLRYGLGFWLAADGPQAILDGGDHGVTFHTEHDPTTARAWTILCNTDRRLSPLRKCLGAHVFGVARPVE